MDEYDPTEDWSPSSWLGAYASDLWNSYLDYWELQNIPDESELTQEDRARNSALYAFVEAVVPCLHTLSVESAVLEKVRAFLVEFGVDTSIDDDTAARVARAVQGLPIVRDGIRLDLAMQATDNLLRGAEQRASILVSLIALRRLSDRAAAFLDRATQLYLWGFEPEAVVMCASVLEAAYEARFPGEEMFRLQVTRKGAEFQPHEYEQAAIAAQVFSLMDKRAAEAIRRARNDTLHNVPNVTLGAEKALNETANLLNKLFPTLD